MEESTYHKLNIFVKEYDYLSDQLGEVKLICKRGERSIAEYLVENIEETTSKENKIYLEITPPASSPIPSVKKESTPLPSRFKKIFRKIMFITHPDKFPDGLSSQKKLEYKNIFEKVMGLHEKEMYLPFLLYAHQLDITINEELFEEDFSSLFKEVGKLRKEMENLKNSMEWKFFIEFNESEKNLFIKKLRRNLAK